MSSLKHALRKRIMQMREEFHAKEVYEIKKRAKERKKQTSIMSVKDIVAA